MPLSIFAPNLADKAASKTTVPLGWLQGWSVQRRRQRLQRQAFNSLLKVDADILEDVTGLRRDQVERAAMLPLSVDATKAVRMMRQQTPFDGWREVGSPCDPKEGR